MRIPTPNPPKGTPQGQIYPKRPTPPTVPIFPKPTPSVTQPTVISSTYAPNAPAMPTLGQGAAGCLTVTVAVVLFTEPLALSEPSAEVESSGLRPTSR